MADASGPATVTKIKGGKWTVGLFFIVSVAYTSGWMTISSLLGYYGKLYGPQVLLAMNIAYFLPSIPLLIVSGLYDEMLDQKFGVPQTILARLIIGLGGCAGVCASFPFFKESSRTLLLAVTLLGLFQAIAFSASYQMVARFANKNVVSLGLGCVSSGLVTLLLETSLGMGTSPARLQFILLFEVTAGLIMVGLAAAVSLVTRHWVAITAWSAPEPSTGTGLGEPLLSAGANLTGNHSVDLTTTLRSMDVTSRAWRRVTEPQMLPVVNPIEFHIDAERDLLYGEVAQRLCEHLEDDELLRALPGGDQYMPLGSPQAPSPFLDIVYREALERQAVQVVATEIDRARLRTLQNGPIIEEVYDVESPVAPVRSVFANHMGPRGSQSPAQTSPAAWNHMGPRGSPSAPQTTRPTPYHMGPHGAQSAPQANFSAPGPSQPAANDDTVGSSLFTLAAVWHCVLALFLSGTYFVLIFPFFTYIPSSGALGQQLPKVLFFVRLFTDVLGRMAPRSRWLAIRSPGALLALGFSLTASVPLFFWYIKDPPFLSDTLAVVYIALGWALGGYINTSCYTVAPLCVEGVHKAMANGLLALTYQVAHTFGLLFAVFLAYLLFGDLTPAPSGIAFPPPPPPIPPPALF